MESDTLHKAVKATRIHAAAGLVLSVFMVLLLALGDQADDDQKRKPGVAVIVFALLGILHVVNLVQARKLAEHDPGAKSVIRGVTITLIVVGLLGLLLSWIVNVIGGVVVLVLLSKVSAGRRAQPPSVW